MKQTTSTLMMVRPASFGYNQETAISNSFQKEVGMDDLKELGQNVLAEFDGFVAHLRKNGLEVIVIEDTPTPPKPDAIFPNNWIMMRHDGEIALFPMEAANRRNERRPDIIEKLKKDFTVTNLYDLSPSEKESKYLEGTGSIVCDHVHKLAYACLSPRTHPGVLDKFCKHIGYDPIAFNAHDKQGRAIYHTNVMMCIGSGLAVVCSDAISDKEQRQKVLDNLHGTGHEIIRISFDQMNRFAGNMLQVKNKAGDDLLVMSSQACHSLEPSQLEVLQKHVRPVHSPLDTIERVGGGSARCMVAEIFLSGRT